MNLLLDFIYIVGIIFLFLMVFLLKTKKGSDRSHNILIIIFLLLSGVLLFYYGELHQLKYLQLAMFPIEDSIVFLVSPLLYLYIKSLRGELGKLLRWTNLKHFILFFLFFLVITIPVLYYVLSDKLVPHLQLFVPYYDFVIPFQILILLFYSTLSIRLLASHKTQIIQNFSNLEKVDLTWVNHFIIGTLIVGGVDLSTTLYELIIRPFTWDSGIATIVALVFLIIYLGFHGFTQSKVLLPAFAEVSDKNETEEKQHLSKKKGIYPLINQEETTQLTTKLDEIMTKEKVFTNPNLTLNMLAEKMGISNKKLSFLLNHHLNSSFYELVNFHRIEEVKSKIQSEEHKQFTLLALAFDAGFQSKTTFNRIFKKQVGMSPSAYKLAMGAK